MLGSVLGMAAAVLSSGSALAIRKLGQAERAPVVALAFHTSSVVLSSVPLAFGYPQRAEETTARDGGLLVAVAVTSFFGQLLMTRALQRTAAARVSAISFSQVIYSYALSAIFFHTGITLVSAAGVLCTLCGVAMVALRYGPAAPAAPAPAASAAASMGGAAAATSSAAPSKGGGGGPTAAPGESLTERLLNKQASSSSGGGGLLPSADSSPERSRSAFAAQRSMRALASIKRVSETIVTEGGAAAAAAASAPFALLRQLSVAASAQMSTAPSMSAADFAMAAEGSCIACTAMMAATNVAFEAFVNGEQQGGPGGGGAGDEAGLSARAASEAARVVALAFAGEEHGRAGSSSGGGEGGPDLIGAGREAASIVHESPRTVSRLLSGEAPEGGRDEL